VRAFIYSFTAYFVGFVHGRPALAPDRLA